MKLKKIIPTKGEQYEVAVDDRCLVVKSGQNKVWISKAMAHWIAFNFADKANVDIKIWGR